MEIITTNYDRVVIVLEVLNNINSEIVNMIPKDMAYKHCMVPVAMDENFLYINIGKDLDSKVINYLKFIYKKNIKINLIDKGEIYKSLSTYYGKEKEDYSMEEILKEESCQDYNLMENEDSPASRITNNIINEAIVREVSDIHIEPEEKEIIIRYRKDGTLFQFMKLPKAVLSSIIIRIKIMAAMNIAEKRIPQDGKIGYNFQGSRYDLRISSIPITHGEKIVIRILYKDKGFKAIGSLGFSEKQLSIVKNMMNFSHGMVLVTGPTGSGKSTTLYAMLNEMNNQEINITTIEDPVEYSIKGVNQINVNTKAGITFANGLRSILRQDPDIIMIGEIRDEETAAIALRAAITGHKVFSTLHTNDSIGAIYRLTEMGIKKYMLLDALIGVISQRLCRKLCNNCKESYTIMESEKKLLEVKEDITLYKAKGCSICNFSGYLGRALISEVLYLDSNKKHILMKSEDINDFRSFLKAKGYTGIYDSYRELLLKGEISIKEIFPIINQELSNHCE